MIKEMEENRHIMDETNVKLGRKIKEVFIRYFQLDKTIIDYLGCFFQD